MGWRRVTRNWLAMGAVGVWSLGGCASGRSEVAAAPSKPAPSAARERAPGGSPDAEKAGKRKRILLRCGSAPDETTLGVLSETASALRLMDLDYAFDEAGRHDAVLSVKAECRDGALTGELRLQAGSDQGTKALSSTKKPSGASGECAGPSPRDLFVAIGELFDEATGENPAPAEGAASGANCAEQAARLRSHDYWREDSSVALDREPLSKLLSVLSTEPNACRCGAVSALKARYLEDEKVREAARGLLEAADPELRRGGAYLVAMGSDPKAYAWAKRVLARAEDSSEVLGNAAALVGNSGTAEDTAALLALSSKAVAQGSEGRDLRRNLGCALEKLTGRASPGADEDADSMTGLTPAARAKLVAAGELRCGSVIYTCRTLVRVLSRPKYTVGKCALEPPRTEKRLLENRLSYTPPARRAKRATRGG
jgi:hypothetical protein